MTHPAPASNARGDTPYGQDPHHRNASSHVVLFAEARVTLSGRKVASLGKAEEHNVSEVSLHGVGVNYCSIELYMATLP